MPGARSSQGGAAAAAAFGVAGPSHAAAGLSPGASSSSSVHFSISESDILKAILEYLEMKGLHITQLSLERETGVINGDYSDDLLFLRQLIIDGQWDNALDFVEPLKHLENFDFRGFRYNITKYKFFELLCIKLEPGPMHDNDFAVEELVECLKDLEHIAPSPEDYRQLCAMLTLPKLSDHDMLKHWNPSSARIECINKVRPLISAFLPPPSTTAQVRNSAVNDRMVSLLVKGIFYEACVDYCQSQAIGDSRGIESGPIPSSSLLSTRPRLAPTDLSLISWLEIVGREQFAMPFQQKSLDFRIDPLKKPKLEAQWTEQILAAPIKPGGAFPHAMVPTGKSGALKFTEKMMSQSLNFMPNTVGMGGSMTGSIFPPPNRVHPMSQSTAPSIGFSITPHTASANGNESLMQQSALIENLFEKSVHTKSSRPGGTDQEKYHIFYLSKNNNCVAPQVIAPVMAQSFNGQMGGDGGTGIARRQLDEITRRSLPPSSQRQSSLPPVPELSTPGMFYSTPMTQSRLFQEFASRQLPRHILPMYDQRMQQQQHMQPMQQMDYVNAPPLGYAPQSSPQPQTARPVSMVPQSEAYPPQPQSARPLSYPPSSTSGMPVQFVPVCRYEDSQAIRAVAFHPTGRFFAIGTNSKQLHICRYPDVRKHRSSEAPRTPEVLLSRPKQHRGSVYCLGFNPTGELLATGSNDKSLRLMAFNAEACKIGAEMELNVHDGTVRDVIFLDDQSSTRSSVLVSGGAGSCHLHLSDCNSGQTFSALRGHTAPILGLYTWASSGGNQFVSCSQDKTIRFWDIRQSTPTNVIAPGGKISNAPVTSVCVDPSGALLVSGHEDASVTMFDIGGGRVLQTFRPHADEVRTVRFSNAAYYLLSASYDRRIVITDMRGDLMNPLMYLPVAEHTDKVIQCRWHPYDFSFLSTSADRSAVLWALPTPTYQ
ncbi:hypothetical protein PENTCL1PPCAC_24873 [Pristionchus entomophagus]|uniref:CTLH domain-containing protein n=1 Tax=Pristionchus entomophagus TaxID=358040 RepID=A0AAV5U8I7_9BILA|nr:hypothetical protein PENTCL1PPCAC_24873 [Pristionchus entomophagus]